jgi:hypothetical protein
MGQDGVGVLEVGDEDEPVVDVKVRDTVDDEHLGEAPLDGPVGKTGKHGTDSNVGDDDLGSLGVSENVGPGVVVCTSARSVHMSRQLTVGVGGVTKLSRSVPDQVQRPSEELVHHHVEELVDGSIFNSLSELGLSESGNADISTTQSNALEDLLDTLDLLILLDGGVAQLGSSSGDKDLVSGHVSSSGVVLTVRDSPRVVRNKEDRVQDPSDKIVDALAGRVGLMTTLVTASQPKSPKTRMSTHAMIQRPVPKRPVTKV